MSQTILTPVGRLVGGHPMERSAVLDKITKLPKMQADGVTPSTQAYVGLALAKTPGVDWTQEPWGQIMVAEALAGWPNGESQHPTFAWKITDGDSLVPGKPFNGKPGKIPAEREGYPGHWVLRCSTGLPIKAYHAGKYTDIEQIKNKNEIKPGDYCRLQINCKANNPSESPGVYLNPNLFELVRAGIQIQLGDGANAADAFGGSAPVVPANAQIDNAVAAPPTPPGPAGAPPVPPGPVTPAPDFLNGAAPPPPVAEVKYTIPQGTQHTKAELLAFNWTEPQIDALPNTGAAAAPPPVTSPPAPPKYIHAGAEYTREQLLGAKWTEAQINALPVADDIPF